MWWFCGNRTSSTQVHELLQSHCSDNRKGTLFSWLHNIYTSLQISYIYHQFIWNQYPWATCSKDDKLLALQAFILHLNFISCFRMFCIIGHFFPGLWCKKKNFLTLHVYSSDPIYPIDEVNFKKKKTRKCIESIELGSLYLWIVTSNSYIFIIILQIWE